MRGSKGVRAKPRNILLYGEHGTGKTTLAATFPEPYLIDVEGGSDDIDIWRSDRVKTVDDFQAEVNWLLTVEHNARTVVVDTVDWLEKMVQVKVASDRGKTSIEDIGYGKGYTFAAEEMEKLLISSMRSMNARGLACLILGHAKCVRHSPHDGDSFERWEPDLHDKTQGPLMEFCDEVLFLKRNVFTKKEDLGFNKTRSIVVGAGQRVFVCSDTGSVVAKNRLQMPDEIPATFADYAGYVMAARARATVIQPEESKKGDIAGIVNEGSSKPKEVNEAANELAETEVF